MGNVDEIAHADATVVPERPVLKKWLTDEERSPHFQTFLTL